MAVWRLQKYCKSQFAFAPEEAAARPGHRAAVNKGRRVGGMRKADPRAFADSLHAYLIKRDIIWLKSCRHNNCDRRAARVAIARAPQPERSRRQLGVSIKLHGVPIEQRR